MMCYLILIREVYMIRNNKLSQWEELLNFKTLHNQKEDIKIKVEGLKKKINNFTKNTLKDMKSFKKIKKNNLKLIKLQKKSSNNLQKKLKNSRNLISKIKQKLIRKHQQKIPNLQNNKII